MKTQLNILQLTVLFIMTAFAAIHAAEVSENDILAASRKWIADNAIFQAEQPDAIPEKAVQMTDADGKAMPLWRVDLQPSGYLVMSSDDTLPPVVAFNTKGSFETPSDHPLPALLERQSEIFQTELGKPQTRGNELAEENKARWNALLNRTRAETITPSTIVTAPLLTTEWNQNAPYNYFCPSGSSYVEHALTGCVPTAFAQMLKYHEWPVVGNGTKTYTDAEGNIQKTLTADFSVPYDWNAMTDTYTEKEERDYGAAELSVARLIMEMGVLVEANYELTVTEAHSHNINTLLAQYLGYSNSIAYGDSRSGYIGYIDQPTLYSRIRSDMVAGRPAIVSYSQGTNGHCFIADGLGTMGSLDYYHFNYGWGGEKNGWYLLTDGYESTVISSATTNIQPQPVAVFKPMSCEQTSSFTLSWDFPKRIAAEAFRLTKTTGTRASTVISSSISGNARSYNLTGQSGTATYTLEAKVNGEWQAASDGVTVTVKTAPATMLSLTVDSNLKSIAGNQVSTAITANNSLTSLTITSNRPDILTASGITVTGSGTSRTVKLTPASDTIGNVLLYVTATDTAGNTLQQTIPLAVMKDEPLTWHTTLADALEAAKANGKLVLMVAGQDGCAYTRRFRFTYCEQNDIKANILQNYELWYCVDSEGAECRRYNSRLGSAYPWVAIIDPNDTNERLRGHGRFSNGDEEQILAEVRDFLDIDKPYFSLDDNTTYDYGIPLELSVLTSGTVIYYRLDDQIPTTSDMLYSTAIRLLGTTTITARAFKNGIPTDEPVTKTYNFSPLTEFPEAMEIATGNGLTLYSVSTPWTLQTTTYNSAPSALQSGAITDNGCTDLVAKVGGPGTVSFNWQVSSQEGGDMLIFYIDGIAQAGMSGSVNWTRKSYTISGEGDHYLTWKYSKDGSISKYNDCAWVDDIIWSPKKYLDSIAIEGDDTIATNSTATYICKVTWSDGTTTEVNRVWSIKPLVYASIDKSNGVLTNQNTTTTDQLVKLEASFTYSGRTRTDSKNITLAKKELTGVSIAGPDRIAAEDSATYTCTASWTYGESTKETPTWTVEPTTYASVDSTGQVTNKNTTTKDQTVKLNASYTVNGVTKTDSLDDITLAGMGNEPNVQTLPLTAGWNWVGFYVLPTSHKVGDVLGTTGFSTNDFIQTNSGRARFSGAGWLPSGFTIEYGKMYQIHMEHDMTVEISGDTSELTSLPLVVGWNWIANPTAESVTLAQLEHNGGWTANDRIQSSGGVAAAYTGDGWSPSANFSLKPGKGYQIYTANEGTLTFSPAQSDEALYVVVDLSDGPDATNYPVRYSATGPDLNDDTCCTTELWLRKIPAGKFIMGSPEDEVGHNCNSDSNETQHEVTLTQDYYIGVFECTQRQWELVMGSKPSYYSNATYYATRPVEQVSYDMIRGTSVTSGAGWPTYGHAVDASSFMGKLQVKTGLIFDLPTEAQWEYACRAGTTTALNSGKNLTSTSSDIAMDEVGRYLNNGGSSYSTTCTTANGTAKVGSYLPNAWGLYDMHGNLWEWCLDWWYVSSYGTDAVSDPVGPMTGSVRVLRGGGWNFNAQYCRSAYRGNAPPSYGDGQSYFGFRVVCLPRQDLYAVVDLSGGPDATSYPVRYTDIAPNLDDDTCRTTELWLRKIPAGTFIMGSPEDEVGYSSYDMAQHEVTLTQDYYIGVFECTQKQWELVMGSNPSSYKGDCRPVEQVSYNMIRGTEAQAGGGWPAYGHAVDALSFMGKLQTKTGLTFDLPTEAQWEYACRAGTTTALNSGKDLTNRNEDAVMNEVGRYRYNQSDGKGGYSEHTKVGSYLSNAWGIYDMHGNVWEWCLDWYGASRSSTAAVSDPIGPNGSNRMLRGNSWNGNAGGCRSAARNFNSPSFNSTYYGFRVACHQEQQDLLYAVVDLSGGPDAESYPVRYSAKRPDLDDDTCRTTELWLRRIPAGTFIMGSPEDEVGRCSESRDRNETQHEVTLTQAFYIGVFECTQKQWNLIMGNNPSYFKKGDMNPVENVSYNILRGTSSTGGAGWPTYGHAVDPTSFMGKLRTKTGLIFDLPTEAQWEYACRAGTVTALNSGQDLTATFSDANMTEVGRYYSNKSDGKGGDSTAHTKVGSYRPNAWGLYDMHGNVDEWCLDWLNRYEEAAVEDPLGPTEGALHVRVLRGGTWCSGASGCRSAMRIYQLPSGYSGGEGGGFRIVCLP